MLEEADVEHHLSPRFQICPGGDNGEFTDASTGDQIANNGTLCMKFIDTKQEESIDLGVAWPYDELDPNECIVSTDLKDAGVRKGSTIRISIGWTDYWNNMAT